MAGTEHPTGTFVLSLIGGLLVLIDGVAIFLFGISGYVFRYHEYVPFVRPVITVIGIWGIICAIVILLSNFILFSHPDQHSLWGIVILIFSILSIASGGGFLLGLILGVIGGIWALVWRPSEKKTEPTTVPPQ